MKDALTLGTANKPIRDVAYETLKHAIITGDLPAGTRIIETYYAQKLHISRTPLREALRLLELDGLVEYKERKGVVVSAFTIEDIDEIFSIRNALMLMLIPDAVNNMTDADLDELRSILKRMDEAQEAEDADKLALYNRMFHKKIEHASNRTRILRVIDSQEEYIKRFSAIAIAAIVRRSRANDEHHQMLHYLEARDAERLSCLMEKHLDESKRACLDAVKNKNETGKDVKNEGH